VEAVTIGGLASKTLMALLQTFLKNLVLTSMTDAIIIAVTRSQLWLETQILKPVL